MLLTSEIELHADAELAGRVLLVNNSDGLVGSVEDQVRNKFFIRAVLALKDQHIALLIEETIHVWVLELDSEVHSLVVNHVEIYSADGLGILVDGLHIDVEELVEASFVFLGEETCVDVHRELELTLRFVVQGDQGNVDIGLVGRAEVILIDWVSQDLNSHIVDVHHSVRVLFFKHHREVVGATLKPQVVGGHYQSGLCGIHLGEVDERRELLILHGVDVDLTYVVTLGVLEGW